MESLQKLMMAGLGATATTAEKVETALKDLVEQGKITKEDAAKLASKILDESKQEFTKAKSDFATGFEELLRKANLVTLAEYRALEKRVADLEAALASKDVADSSQCEDESSNEQ